MPFSTPRNLKGIGEQISGKTTTFGYKGNVTQRKVYWVISTWLKLLLDPYPLRLIWPAMCRNNNSAANPVINR